MWINGKDLEKLVEHNARFSNYLLEMSKQLANLSEIGASNAASVKSLTEAMIMTNKSITLHSSVMLELTKRIKAVEDFQQLNGGWTTSAKYTN